MSGPKAVTPVTRVCPFCGVTTDVPHESQAGCITALQHEIDRVRDVLSALKPAGLRPSEGDDDDHPARLRVALSDGEVL
jgi:hypothetical protein